MAKVRKSATDQSHVNKLYRDNVEQGNENQREWFNSQRDVKQKRTKSGSIIGSSIPGFKVSKSDADSQGFDMAAERKRQRSGGKGK